MIAHLRGRQEVLRALGWKGRRAEWIALAALGSSYFVPAQLARFLGVQERQAKHIIRMMSKREIVNERPIQGHKVHTIRDLEIYRALGEPNLRPRFPASEDVIMRCLLSLDYMVEQQELAWLPTESDKVGAFEAMGIGSEVLPKRFYNRFGSGLWRLFPDKRPIALEDGRALFVFTDPGYTRSAPLRRWGAAHRGLWDGLRERGWAVHVVAVVRTVRVLQRALRVVGRWARPAAVPARAVGAARAERERIERAVLEGDERALAPYGDLQAGLKRMVELEDFESNHRPWPRIDTLEVWRSGRLAGGWS